MRSTKRIANLIDVFKQFILIQVGIKAFNMLNIKGQEIENMLNQIYINSPFVVNGSPFPIEVMVSDYPSN